VPGAEVKAKVRALRPAHAELVEATSLKRSTRAMRHRVTLTGDPSSNVIPDLIRDVTPDWVPIKVLL